MPILLKPLLPALLIAGAAVGTATTAAAQLPPTTYTGTVIEDDDNANTVTGIDTGGSLPNLFTCQEGQGYGELCFNGTGGRWTYTLDNSNPAVQALKLGETLTDRRKIASATFIITIQGAADPIVGQLGGSVTEDDTSRSRATGKATITDEAGGAATFVVQLGRRGTFGTFGITEEGNWVYDLDNNDPYTQALLPFFDGTDIFTIAQSGAGGATADVAITVKGTPDPGTIEGNLFKAVTEDAEQSEIPGNVQLTRDSGGRNRAPNFSVQSGSGTYGTFRIEPVGAWAYRLDNTLTATDDLVAGQKVTDTFEITAASTGATATVVITITGADDASQTDRLPSRRLDSKVKGLTGTVTRGPLVG